MIVVNTDTFVFPNYYPFPLSFSLFLCVFRRLLLAGEVKQRIAQVRLKDAEGNFFRVGLRVIKSKPPQVGLPQELASNIMPVFLCILSGRHGLAECISSDGPPRLRHPDWLALRYGNGLLVGLKEQGCSILDSVVILLLVVRVPVHTDPVDSVDDGGIASVDPCIPGIDVTDEFLPLNRSPFELVASLLDVLEELIWRRPATGLVQDSGRAHAVEVLGADGYAHNQVGEIGF